MVYHEEKIINGKKFHYLVKNMRLGKKWKKIRVYIGKGEKSKKELEKLKNRYAKELEKKVQNYMKSTDPFLTLVSEKDIKELEKIKNQYKSIYKKMDAITRKKYMDWFLAEFTYNTNAIEGSTLTLQETATILFEGIVPYGKSIREIREVENHRDAFEFILKYKGDVNKDFILEIHKKLMHNILWKYAGVFRDKQVYIRGADFIPPKPEDVDKEFNELMKWYRKNKKRYHPVIVTSYMHAVFEGIHPFLDGNGRVGRLLLNFMLGENGFPMIDIKNKDKLKYYNTLQKAQRGNLRPFVELVIFYIKSHEVLQGTKK